MDNKKKLLIVGVLLVAVFAIIVAVLSNRGGESQTASPVVSEEASSDPVKPSAKKENVTTAEAEISQEAEEAIESLDIPEKHKKGLRLLTSIYSNPFDFYGKVIDENDQPIPNAEVGYTLINAHFAPGEKGSTQSDEDGLFTITGNAGALTVGVEKDGYYGITDYSSGAFSTTMNRTPELMKKVKPPYEGGYDRPLPTKDSPAVFVLKKKGIAEELIRTSGRYAMSNDGTPIGIDLTSGSSTSINQADIKFEYWGDKSIQDQRGNHDWRFRITVPGGGLTERSGEFDFEAPESGYQQSVEINMPTSLGDEWKYSINRNYFVKLPDGNYGRVQLRIYGGHKYKVTINEALVNPSGSRNLEYDPSLAVKP